MRLACWVVDDTGAVRASAPFDEALELVIGGDAMLDAVGSLDATEHVVELATGVWAIPIPARKRRVGTGVLAAVAFGPGASECSCLRASAASHGVSASALTQLMGDHEVLSADAAERLAVSLRTMQSDIEGGAESSRALFDVSRQLGEAYEEINLLHTLTRSMNEVANPGSFVQNACDELCAASHFGWVAAAFVQDPKVMRSQAGATFRSGQDNGQTIAEAVRLASSATDPEGRVERHSTLGLVLVQPILRNGVPIGVALAGGKTVCDEEINSIDIAMVESTTRAIGVLAENAFLYEDQQAMFIGTLGALTGSIDAKDPYTRGHSERVAHLGRQLALAAGMTEPAAERVHIGGLVHDIGKIGVPESVLSKPGRLTDEEFDLIRLHPRIGYDILRDIPLLEDVLPGVLYHHERYDGRGYPAKLEGESIPLIARILGIADAFDAMSSTRTYRRAMPRPQVIGEVEKNAGVQFDPELAKIFVTLDFTVYDQLVQQHQRLGEGSAAA